MLRRNQPPKERWLRQPKPPRPPTDKEQLARRFDRLLHAPRMTGDNPPLWWRKAVRGLMEKLREIYDRPGPPAG